MTSSDVRSSAVLVSAETPSCVAQAQTTSPSTGVALRPTNPCVKGRMVWSVVCAVCRLQDARGSDERKRVWCEGGKHKNFLAKRGIFHKNICYLFTSRNDRSRDLKSSSRYKVLVRHGCRSVGDGLIKLLSFRVDLCEEMGTRAMNASAARMEKIGDAQLKGKTEKKNRCGLSTSDGRACLHAPFQISSSSSMSDVPI